MKRRAAVYCVVACSVLLGACQTKQQKTQEVQFVNLGDVVVSGTAEWAEELQDTKQSDDSSPDTQSDTTQQSGDSPDMQSDTTQQSGDSPDMQSDTAQQSGDSPDTQSDTTQQPGTIKSGEQSTQNAAEVYAFMAGNVGTIGTGWLVYTVPVQDNEDYRLYFFKSEDLSKDWNKADFNLEKPDYVFPDVRENNASIGRFGEIYFGEFIDITGSGAAELVVIASYEVDGKTCYDTRVYQTGENGYSANAELMQELNGKYRDASEYPVQELYRRSPDTGDERGVSEGK